MVNQGWWDAARIDQVVNRQFVEAKLLPEEIERLNRPLAFGDVLTNGSYWDWLERKAKRLFLILVDLGVTDQIFGIIDDSWDDNDLPIPLEHIGSLALKAAKDERIERRFYVRQFYYLLRPLQRSDYLIYNENEVVPLDLVSDRRAGLVSNQAVDKVTLPNHPNQVFSRRRVPFGKATGILTTDEFFEVVKTIKNIQNDHVVSYWASYVHQEAGYLLFTPASDFTLKSFLSTTPSSFKNLTKRERREMVMNWILCLVDSLCYVHNRRKSHGNIKPSSVLFNNNWHIFYSDFSRFGVDATTSQSDKNTFDRESYDYAAPEQWFRPTSGPTSPGSRKATLSFSTSPTNFSITRGDYNPSTPNAMLQTPNPMLNPQAADIFSLGCVILELMSFLLKKQARFASHRSEKHKTPGRGGAVLDSSFHKNLGQVEIWMSILAKEASKKVSESDGGAVFRGITPMLHIVACMLSANPHDRPSAFDVQQRVYQILTEYCNIPEPHCVHQYGGWDFGLGSVRRPTVKQDEVTIETKSPPRKRLSDQFNLRLPGHSRSNSNDVMSQSGSSSSTASSSDRGGDLGASFATVRNIQVRNPRSPPTSPGPTWQSPSQSIYTGSSNSASVY
jgi:serine/threonine protein kinase